MSSTATFRILGLALAVIVSSPSTGCRRAERPAFAAWEPQWQLAKAALPARSAFDGTRDREVCEAALSALRAANARLLPSPSPDLDGLVQAWVRVAEEMMYECPARSGEFVGFEGGFEELARLDREIRDAATLVYD